ncbi:MAG: alpha/beta hydrolase [Terracidiphilus sp.]|jgi:pimeloyl-ACP methyl ester carboxylesterase
MVNRLILLPGMHGTGELFSEFVKAMPEPRNIEAIYYPVDASPSYSELLETVQFMVPASELYFLLAESYSTPLAIKFAATHPPNLRGLILCAGFATSPIRGWPKSLAALIAPLAFRLPLPKAAVSHFLVGKDAPEWLRASVRSAIRAVKPAVLAARLRQVLSVDARQALIQVSVPILFIQALQDRLVGEASLEQMCAIKPQIEVARIPGSHLILQREPQRAAEVVASFIQQLAPD